MSLLKYMPKAATNDDLRRLGERHPTTRRGRKAAARRMPTQDRKLTSRPKIVAMNNMKYSTEQWGPPHLYDSQHEERGMKLLRAAFLASSKHHKTSQRSIVENLAIKNLSLVTPWTKAFKLKYNKSRFRPSGSILSQFSRNKSAPKHLKDNLFDFRRSMGAMNEKWSVQPTTAVFGDSIPAWEEAPSDEPIRAGCAAIVLVGDLPDAQREAVKVLTLFSVDFGVEQEAFEGERIVDFAEIIWYRKSGPTYLGVPALRLERTESSDAPEMSSDQSLSNEDDPYFVDVILADAISHATNLVPSAGQLWLWDQFRYPGDASQMNRAKRLSTAAPASARRSAFWKEAAGVERRDGNQAEATGADDDNVVGNQEDVRLHEDGHIEQEMHALAEQEELEAQGWDESDGDGDDDDDEENEDEGDNLDAEEIDGMEDMSEGDDDGADEELAAPQRVLRSRMLPQPASSQVRRERYGASNTRSQQRRMPL
jgi:hypothetical protein